MNAVSRRKSGDADAVNGAVAPGTATDATDAARVAPQLLDPLVAALAKAVARQGNAMGSGGASP